MASKRQRKRKDGTVAWLALYRKDGRQTSLTFDTAIARDQWVNLVDQIGLDGALEALGAMEGSSGSEPSFREYALADIELRDISAYQADRYRKWVETDYPAFVDLPLSVISETMVRKWIRGQVKKGVAGKTIRNKHGFMSSVFKAATLDRSLPDFTVNPCAASKLPRADSGESEEITALTPSEFALLVDNYVPEAFKDFVTCSAFLAPRFSEITAFPVSAWHPERGDFGELQVFRAWKRQPSGPPLSGPPKTKKAVRPLPVNAEIAGIIDRLVLGKEPDDLIFTMPNGDRIDHNNFYHRVWMPAVTLANGKPLLHRRTGQPMVDEKGHTKVTAKHTFYGVNPALPRTKEHPERAGILGKWPTIHDLRHSGASWLVEATGDLQLVQEFLGHESITTTVDLYADFLPHRKKAMAAGISRMYEQAFPKVEVLEAKEAKQIEGHA